MPTTCGISFEKPDGVYFAGEILRCTVNLQLTNTKKVRGIYVRIFGEALAHWSRYCKTDHGPRRDENGKVIRSGGHHVTYSGSEVYLDDKTYLIGGSDSDPFDLEPGEYIHTFQCQLPTVLPTSFQHKNGHIIYGVKIVLDIPHWPDKKFSSNFSLIKRIDLNIDPLFRLPITNKTEKTFYPLDFFCCCPSGPLMISGTTKVRGFAPGQTINITINVCNDSHDHVQSLTVKLNKQIIFFGRSSQEGHYGETRELYIDYVVAEETTRSFGPGDKDTVFVNLRVPAIPPTDSSTSRIIRVDYLIRFTATMEDCCTSFTSFDLPITIGTIPIRDNFDVAEINSNSVISAQPAQTRAPIDDGAATPMLTEHPVLTRAQIEEIRSQPSTSDPPSAPSASIDFSDNPPSYEEAMNMKNENTDKFKPKYPMFRRDTSYSIGDE